MITIYQELISSKNSKNLFRNRKTGKLFVAKNIRAQNSQKSLLDEITSKRDSFLQEMADIEKPYYCLFKIYRKTHRRFDYVNIIQLLSDCMTIAGIWEDDCADVVIPCFAPYEVDKNNPRVEISFLRDKPNYVMLLENK